MTELGELEPFEHAALVIEMKGLAGQDALEILRSVEPRLSDSTYYRRLADGRLSLERKGLLTRLVDRREIVWLPTPNTFPRLSHKELADLVRELILRHRDAQREAVEKNAEANRLQRMLDAATKEIGELREDTDNLKRREATSLDSQLINRFKRLGLTKTWIDVLVSVTLLEVMARYKLTTIDPSRAEEKLTFSDLLKTLEDAIPSKEGRAFSYDKTVANFLYGIRGRMVHSGPDREIRPKEAEGIAAFVDDLYKQLFEPTT